MLAALPLAVVVGSPQRVVLSAAIAAAYVVAAVVTARSAQVNKLVVVYVGVAAIWMVAALLRSKFLLHLQPEQLDYATSSTLYFVFIVLPMAAAVTMLVGRAEAMWPAVITQIAIGAVVALVTIALLGDRFLGVDRYSWQGDLIALGTVLAVQPWPLRRFKASAVLGLLGAAAVVLASSRQAVAAVLVGFLLSAVYWTAARHVKDRYVLLPLVLAALMIFYLGLTYAGDIGLHISGGSIVSTGPSSASCHCVTDRIVSLQASAGDRDKLLARGVHMFLAHPLFGAGIGAFAGTVPDSMQPGHFYAYPHNVPLEIASETGLVGLLLMLVPLVVGWVLLLLRGIKQASAPIASVLMLVAVFFTVANVSGDIPSERGLWIFGLVAFSLGVDRLRARREAFLARVA